MTWNDPIILGVDFLKLDPLALLVLLLTERTFSIVFLPRKKYHGVRVNTCKV